MPDGWKSVPTAAAPGTRMREEFTLTRARLLSTNVTRENNVSLHGAKRCLTPDESSERAIAEDSERCLTRSSFE